MSAFIGSIRAELMLSWVLSLITSANLLMRGNLDVTARLEDL